MVVYVLSLAVVNSAKVLVVKNEIPKKLRDMAGLMYGTADKGEETPSAVINAIRSGFRGFDTANQPGNFREDLLGDAIQSSQIAREKLFLQTKFVAAAEQHAEDTPYDRAAEIPQQVEQSISSSLKKLRIHYIDSLLLNGAYPTDDDTLLAWRAMEKAYDAGQVMMLGVANFEIAKLNWLYSVSRIKPHVLQSPFLLERGGGWDRSLRQFCVKNSIWYQGYSIITGNRHMISTPVVNSMAGRQGSTPEAVLLQYASSLGVSIVSGPRQKLHMHEIMAWVHGTWDNTAYSPSRPEPDKLPAADVDTLKQWSMRFTDRTSVQVRFTNDLNTEWGVYWQSPNGELVAQTVLGTVNSNRIVKSKNVDDSSFEVGTRHGHSFVFKEVLSNPQGVREPKQDGISIMWRADAARGAEQHVHINGKVSMNFEVSYAQDVEEDHPIQKSVDVYLVGEDGSLNLQGYAEPHLTLSAYCDQIFIAKLKLREQWSIKVDCLNGMDQIVDIVIDLEHEHMHAMYETHDDL